MFDHLTVPAARDLPRAAGSWKIVERRIGRAGGVNERTARQREWTTKYGESWTVGYTIDGAFVTQDDALESVYSRSYEHHFAEHPEDLEELYARRRLYGIPTPRRRQGSTSRCPPS